MEYRFSKYGVARGARADAVDLGRIVLIKSASSLKLTYQIRLLTYQASSEGRKLLLFVRRDCKIDKGLMDFMKQHRTLIKKEYIE